MFDPDGSRRVPAPAPIPTPTPPRVPKPRAAEPERRDSLREAVETVVFVVFLVLLLKAFVAEAFVIPTGSMATTLLGDHLDLKCDKCGYGFPVNVREHLEREVEGRMIEVGREAICPNCRHVQLINPNTLGGGDKVLVAKPQYDLTKPDRFDVIVFKFPGKFLPNGVREQGPQNNYTALNYIKRLWGLPGEKLAIWYGDVYTTPGQEAVEQLQSIRKPPAKILEMRRIVHDSDFPARDLEGFVPPRWEDAGQPAAWQTKEEGGGGLPVFHVQAAERTNWLRYHHRLRPDRPRELRARLEQVNQKLQALEDNGAANPRRAQEHTEALSSIVVSLADNLTTLEGLDRLAPAAKREQREGIRKLAGALQERISRLPPQRTQLNELARDLQAIFTNLLAEPQLVTDFLGYNTNLGEHQNPNHRAHWVPDLMVDLEVEVESASGQLVLELVAGVDTHQATFDLRTGNCTLQVVRRGQRLQEKQASTSLGKPGKYHVRFANFDHRLTLWIDGELPFGPGMDFDRPGAGERGPRLADLSPAAVGASQTSLKVRHLKLWRDIYYTRTAEPSSDVTLSGRPEQILSLSAEERRQLGPYDKLNKWAMYYDHSPHYYSIKPGEYFALGDNSTRSSDSRDWGGVPEHLLLGEAVLVYWPITRFGLIR
jgi:signal peptidase I